MHDALVFCRFLQKDQAMTTTNPSILLVEDNPDEIVILREALEEVLGGVVVTIKSTVNEALAWLAAQADDELPGLVVTDHHLPDKRGHELIASMRTCPRQGRLPVVMLSGDTCQPPGLDGIAWYEKPSTWSGWHDLALCLVKQHLPGN